MDKLDPELAAALRAIPQQPPPPPEVPVTIEYARQLVPSVYGSLAKYYGEHLPSASAYSVEDKHVPVDGGEISVRIVRPTVPGDYGKKFPVLVWYHGGAWTFGDLETDDNHLRSISVDLQIVIVNVEYRLAPEHPFPTPLNDCYTALKWVVDNASHLCISIDKGLLVGGDSAGGNLSAAIALQARDDPTIPLTGQYLREPPVIYFGEAPPEKYLPEWKSPEENKDILLLFASVFTRLDYMKLYGAPKDDWRVAPLFAPSHAGLAPAFIQVMGSDLLRDEGIFYERALREAGVPTKLVLYPGVPHSFYYLFPEIAVAKKVDRDMRDGLRWLLSFANKS